MVTEQSSFKQISRRSVLSLTGTVALGAGISACSVSTKDSTPGSSGGSGSGKSPAAAITIPKVGADIPKGKTTLSWMDSGDTKETAVNGILAAYHRTYPNIKVNYSPSSWDVIDEAVPLGVRNGTAPDVFSVPNNVPVQTAVNEGWVSPLDDVVPDFAAWKAGFPSGSFLPGIHVFDGKTYTFPGASSKAYATMLFYDTEYMKKANLDPNADRFTWSAFRAACKAITKQGGGKYYGLMMAGTNLHLIISSLAELAGAPGGTMNWKTGEYSYTAPQFEGAIELLKSIQSDQSVFPGFEALGDADSRARMPQRVAGMIFDGVWDVARWPITSPSYNFGMALPPMGDDKRAHFAGYANSGSNYWYLSSKSKNKSVVGDIFHYMGSTAGQTAIVELTGGNLISMIPEANTRAKRTNRLDPRARKYTGLEDQIMRILPTVAQRNSAAADVQLQLKAVAPSLNDVIQGVLVGKISNISKALKSLNTASEHALDDAIAAARKQGAEITRDDWKFPNWDPSKDYTVADYKALPR